MKTVVKWLFRRLPTFKAACDDASRELYDEWLDAKPETSTPPYVAFIHDAGPEPES